MRRFIPFLPDVPTVPVIRLSGTIAANARGAGISDASHAAAIEKAFRGKPAAVALAINSPGGSAVQSSLVAGRIRRLAREKKVKVHAFVEDVAASGGYWLACAGDDIWLDAASITGSIGVITASFGLHDFIGRYGVERRVYTAGKDKSLLDPFRPERAEDVARIKRLQAGVHDSFIAHVRERRGARLSDEPDLFTGEVWVGQGAVEVGLADGIAHLKPKLQELYGDKVRTPVLGPRRPFLARFGVAALQVGLDLVEERASYARYGL